MKNSDDHVCNDSGDEYNEVPECALFNDTPSIDKFDDEPDTIVILYTEDDGLYCDDYLSDMSYSKSNTDDENETLAIITKEHRVSG